MDHQKKANDERLNIITALFVLTLLSLPLACSARQLSLNQAVVQTFTACP
jgi:hypothetical protein